MGKKKRGGVFLAQISCPRSSILREFTRKLKFFHSPHVPSVSPWLFLTSYVSGRAGVVGFRTVHTRSTRIGECWLLGMSRSSGRETLSTPHYVTTCSVQESGIQLLPPTTFLHSPLLLLLYNAGVTFTEITAHSFSGRSLNYAICIPCFVFNNSCLLFIFCH